MRIPVAIALVGALVAWSGCAPARPAASAAPTGASAPAPPAAVAPPPASSAAAPPPASAPEPSGGGAAIAQAPAGAVGGAAASPPAAIAAQEMPADGRTAPGPYYLGRPDAPVTVDEYADFQ